MTAVSVLVYDAMYAAQILGADQTPASGDVQLVLRRLNRLLDLRSNEKQLIYLNDSESFTMTAGQQAYTTAVLAGGRPISINSMRVTLNSIDWTVSQIDQLKWNGIAFKNVSAIPEWFYYDGAMPEASMFFYPIPYAPFTCTLYCQRRLTGSVALTSNLVLPAGYEAWIVAELACDIWPSFKGRQPINRDLLADRTMARGTLKRTNYQPLEMTTPLATDTLSGTTNGFPYRGF